MAEVSGPDTEHAVPSGDAPHVEAFTAFFRREYAELVALGWALTGSRDAAEDVAQDAMTSMYQRWDDIRTVRDPHAYVRRVCVNLAASSFRRRAAELRALLRLSPQRTDSAQLPDTSAGFWAEVRRLPRRQAQTVALYYGCDMSIAEVAEVLDMAGGTVKVHLSRARHALADRLSTPEHREGVAL